MSCSPIFKGHTDPSEGIETLTRHAFNSPSNVTARNAMRCLANAMLIKPEARQIFVDLGYEAKACNKLKNDNRDDEFLVSRILFLTTYQTNINLLALITQHHLADTIVQNLARHVKLLSGKGGKSKSDPMVDLALTETVKLLFNVSHYCPEKTSDFTPAIPLILALLCKHDLPTENPLDPPFGSMVNALLNLDLHSKDVVTALFPKNEPNSVLMRLIHLLDLCLKKYGDNDLEQIVTPLVGVLRKIHETAPGGAQRYIRGRLLPTEEDRQNILGRGDAMSSKLLRHSTNPITPEFRKAISHLLFDMSNKDASEFVKNVGYGFASGFLFQNNIPIPESASEAYSTGSTEGGQKVVNPVTGQFVDAETLPEMPEMTEEEKEREAERLFVLFERFVPPERLVIRSVAEPEQAQENGNSRRSKSGGKGLPGRSDAGY